MFSANINKEQAITILMNELKKGEDSIKSEGYWISEDEIFSEFNLSNKSN